MTPEVIKYFRQLMGISQSELAERVNISSSMISRYECNLVEINPETELKILQVFSDAGISSQDFIQVQMIFNKMKRR
ncbi:helix-turn-helix domain-containing protein [Niallia circulans]|uniref:Helix-turn-helix transcriptional regulator n=1 Tax=Niallia circulans TaxID=1397 RepID=A0A941GFH7_NIACI|nr:helix-turn-helix transcriptional regulator [Niallia circulans]MCB5235894.1 helix-turn-helix domain-containing protein [Niallia circulans]